MADKRITADERKSFTAEKLSELDRMSEARMDAMINPKEATQEEEDAARIAIVASLANRDVDQLKATVNIADFGEPVTYSDDDDYTAEEKAAIGYGWKANRGRRPLEEIPAIIAQNAEMITDGLDADTRKHILKARGA